MYSTNNCKLFYFFNIKMFLNIINNTNIYCIGDMIWQHYLSLTCRLSSSSLINHTIQFIQHTENYKCIQVIKKT